MEADQSCVFSLPEVTMDGQMTDVPQVSLRGEMEVLLGVAVGNDEELLDGPVATISDSLDSLHFVVDLPANEQRVLVWWRLVRLYARVTGLEA